MANDVVIRAEGLGKRYVIGHQSAERVPTLRDAMSRTTANFVRTTRDLLRGKPLIAGDEVEEFWALRDVSFEIRRGDVVGIIGRNGAGKSTLLKILSRITEPSEGRVEIRGRVASLLEVGTGFHPELSGRDNVFLNGAILGMSRAEIRRKFDEIVAFAEIEKFLDTPVKRYSSGMYVRLAFAVAAHLEPEILIVDEVLAVGDAEFQKKCLGKMQDVAGEGRTVLFVSHNLKAAGELCQNGILLRDGRIIEDSRIDVCLARYSALQSRPVAMSDLASLSRRAGGQSMWFRAIKITNDHGTELPYCTTGQPTEFRIRLAGNHPGPQKIRITMSIQDLNENVLLAYDSEVVLGELVPASPGDEFICSTPKLPLSEGNYLVSFFLASGFETLDWIDNQCRLEVRKGSFFNSKNNTPPGWEGRIVLSDCCWSKTEIAENLV